ncbi:hypothetical protein [Streptococcus parauberis]|uniref:hypothetical protein n=1 Tax=Streptococcus parauberis TaxID=1348 RepID=UPI000789AFC5|nr:hypothetical protein [Streptococcus parauberis]KYP20850.1 hypothetical protein AKL13_00472 [Streptococcus parauberis]KYP21234.1 hypothetical protein TN39_00395 [Streptococcus parauberis]KYP22370.1 hypothetical protein AKL14_00367 [Streptococcus parauberis]KYP24893.1 hypothetical protein ADO04_01179 [Streptococcus parauberis]KYP25870.1 hypothetical protein TP84_01248 [Streptococcus parauberis]
MKILVSRSELKSKLIDFLNWTVVMYSFLLTNQYSKSMAVFLGVLLLIASIQLTIKYKDDKFYVLLFSIILYVNLSLFFGDIVNSGKTVLQSSSLAWQIYRGTNFEIIFLKYLAVFLTSLNLLSGYYQFSPEKDNLKNRENIFVFIIGITFLIIALLKGYSTHTGGSYESNATPIYEYAVLVFLLTWFYSGQKFWRHVVLLIYSVFYISQAFLQGDRSSAFPMVVMILLLYFKRLELWKIIVSTFMGVILSNILSVYRESYSIENFLKNYILKYGAFNLASDTVSMSYYTGISMQAVKEMLGNTSHYFKDFLIGIFAGGSFRNADVIQFSKLYAINKGGGLVVGNFAFWFDLFGVLVLSLFVSYVINKVGSSKYDFQKVWKIYITVTVFRWYLYTSFVFFRSVCFIFPVLYFLFDFIDSISKREKYSLTKSFKKRRFD